MVTMVNKYFPGDFKLSKTKDKASQNYVIKWVKPPLHDKIITPKF